MLIPVVLSGGAGTRLWPVSREGQPKPFMRLPDGQTLLGKTYRRAAGSSRKCPRSRPRRASWNWSLLWK